MPDSSTETRTYVGLTGTHAFNAFKSLRIGQPYQLSYTRELDEVRLALPHRPEGAGPLVLKLEEFERWFVK